MVAGRIRFAMSPAVVLEYEDVLLRPGILGPIPWLRPEDIGTVLDVLCARCVKALPRVRFRPFLADPKDDLYVECALAAGAHVVVSEDRHFRVPVMAAFGLTVRSASEFVGEWQSRRTQT